MRLRQPPDTAALPPRRPPWWGALAVLAVLAALVAGWPLVASRFPDERPLAERTVLRIGPDGASAWFRVGAGWTLHKAETRPSQEYVLTRGPTTLTIAYLLVLRDTDADALWEGLRRSTRVADADTRVGPPRALVAERGAKGLVGDMTRSGDPGLAAVYPAPGRDFAIRMLAWGAAAPREPAGPADDLDLAAALAVIRSLTFTEGVS